MFSPQFGQDCLTLIQCKSYAIKLYLSQTDFLFVFYCSTFVGSAWSFVFFIPATTANDLRFEGFSFPDFIHYIYYPILILEKEPAFLFLMFSAKQGQYWYHFYNVFGMMRSLTVDWTRDLPHSKPLVWIFWEIIRKWNYWQIISRRDIL